MCKCHGGSIEIHILMIEFHGTPLGEILLDLLLLFVNFT